MPESYSPETGEVSPWETLPAPSPEVSCQGDSFGDTWLFSWEMETV